MLRKCGSEPQTPPLPDSTNAILSLFVQYPFASSFCLLSTEVHSTLPRPHTLVIQARCILRPAVLFRRVGLSESHRPPSTSPPLVFHTLALSAPPYPGPPVGVRTTATPPSAPRVSLRFASFDEAERRFLFFLLLVPSCDVRPGGPATAGLRAPLCNPRRVLER
jgi:hypothetical protein